MCSAKSFECMPFWTSGAYRWSWRTSRARDDSTAASVADKPLTQSA